VNRGQLSGGGLAPAHSSASPTRWLTRFRGRAIPSVPPWTFSGRCAERDQSPLWRIDKCKSSRFAGSVRDRIDPDLELSTYFNNILHVVRDQGVGGSNPLSPTIL
jgi:hypothetical protein